MSIIEIFLVIIISGFYSYIIMQTMFNVVKLRKEFNQLKEDLYKYILVKKIDSEWEETNANNS